MTLQQEIRSLQPRGPSSHSIRDRFSADGWTTFEEIMRELVALPRLPRIKTLIEFIENKTGVKLSENSFRRYLRAEQDKVASSGKKIKGG